MCLKNLVKQWTKLCYCWPEFSSATGEKGSFEAVLTDCLHIQYCHHHKKKVMLLFSVSGTSDVNVIIPSSDVFLHQTVAGTTPSFVAFLGQTLQADMNSP